MKYHRICLSVVRSRVYVGCKVQHMHYPYEPVDVLDRMIVSAIIESHGVNTRVR